MDYAFQGRNPPTQPAAMVAHTNSAYEEQQWLADSGANAHITNQLDNLQIQQPFQQKKEEAACNGTGIQIENTSSTLFHSLILPLKCLIYYIVHKPQPICFPYKSFVRITFAILF